MGVFGSTYSRQITHTHVHTHVDTHTDFIQALFMGRLLFPGFGEKAIVVSHSSHVTEGFSKGQRSQEPHHWWVMTGRQLVLADRRFLDPNWLQLMCADESIVDTDQRKKASDRIKPKHGSELGFVRAGLLWSSRERERWTERKRERERRCNAGKAAGGIVSLETVKSPRRAQPTRAHTHIHTQHTHNGCRGLSVAN